MVNKLKTLKDFEIEAQKDVDNPGSYAWMNEANYEKEQGEGKLSLLKDLREEAMNILKANKEINTADWIEFFNIEEEFANECLNDVSVSGDEQ